MGMDFYAALTVFVFFGSLLAGLTIICYTIVKLVGAGSGKAAGDEETRMMQEMHHSLLKMEQRVESLETLLYGREREDLR